MYSYEYLRTQYSELRGQLMHLTGKVIYDPYHSNIHYIFLRLCKLLQVTRYQINQSVLE